VQLKTTELTPSPCRKQTCRPRAKQKTRERWGPTRVGKSENEEMLPGDESSDGQKSGTPSLEGGAEVWPDDERRRQTKDRLSGPFACAQCKRGAELHPGEPRVRFEFARRAHQRKFTPRLGINLGARSCQEERSENVENCAGYRDANGIWAPLGIEERFLYDGFARGGILAKALTVNGPSHSRVIWSEGRACGRVEDLGACSRRDRGPGSSW